VTLFASDDSLTKGRLIASGDHAVRLDAKIVEPVAYDVFQLEQFRT
jgi:hypothetical protein